MRWNSLTSPSIRQGNCGTSGVSTETIRRLRWAPWLLWSMSRSMLAPFACGARNRPGVAAKAALRPRVFLRKSRLFFMVLPLKSWRTQLSPRDSMDIGLNRDAQPNKRLEVAPMATALLEGEGTTQMRRMEKDARWGGDGAGGPLSKPHAAVKSGARNSAVALRTTARLRTAVT